MLMFELAYAAYVNITDKIILNGIHSGRQFQQNEAFEVWHILLRTCPARRCRPDSHARTSFRCIFAMNKQLTNCAPRGPGDLLLTQAAFERVT